MRAMTLAGELKEILKDVPDDAEILIDEDRSTVMVHSGRFDSCGEEYDEMEMECGEITGATYTNQYDCPEVHLHASITMNRL